MKKSLLILFCFSASLFANDFEKMKAVADKFCVDCHGPKKQKGKLRLDDLSKLKGHVWEEVYEQLTNGDMPPEDEAQLTSEEKKQFMETVLGHLTTLESASKPALRRLNKREYSNTIRDLLGLYDVYDPGEFIQADDVSHGFDTEGGSLVISDNQLLQYISSASTSLSHAVKTHSPTPPLSIKKNLTVKRFGPKGRDSTLTKKSYITRSRRHVYDSQSKDLIKEPGYYKIKFTACGVDRFFYKVPFKPVSEPFKLILGVKANNNNSTTNTGTTLKTFELKDDIPQEFEAEIWLNAGYYPYFNFVNGGAKAITQIRSAVRQKKLPKNTSLKNHRLPGVEFTSYTVEGPYYKEWPLKSYKHALDSDKALDVESEEIRTAIISKFLFKAFRGQSNEADLSLYLTYLNSVYSEKDGWNLALRKTMSAILASTKFLYLVENDGELNEFPLATRLSYFLWSSTPDKELLSLAKSGQLKDETVYKQQVFRLLNGPKSAVFLDSFASQWLNLKALGTMRPDTKDKRFKAYNPKIEALLLKETKTFFDHVFKNNLSVSEFIEADYTFLNKDLAKYYKVPFTGGDTLTKTKVEDKYLRGGILGQGSILTLTANGVETSPIIRGVWVLDHFLGTPPPPPPKEVPALTPDLRGATTVRQQLEKHRTDPSCNSCHKKMDPIGFALESFDPIGRVRTKYENKTKVESYGTFKGEAFTNINGLKKTLSKNMDSFARNLIIKIAEYGKGRKLNFKDYATVDKILKKSAQNNYRFKDMVIEIAMSDLIRNR